MISGLLQDLDRDALGLQLRLDLPRDVGQFLLLLEQRQHQALRHAASVRWIASFSRTITGSVAATASGPALPRVISTGSAATCPLSWQRTSSFHVARRHIQRNGQLRRETCLADPCRGTTPTAAYRRAAADGAGRGTRPPAAARLSAGMIRSSATARPVCIFWRQRRSIAPSSLDTMPKTPHRGVVQIARHGPEFSQRPLVGRIVEESLPPPATGEICSRITRQSACVETNESLIAST